jgi:hypothetical protein
LLALTCVENSILQTADTGHIKRRVTEGTSGWEERRRNAETVQYGTLTPISAVTDDVSESDATARKLRSCHGTGLFQLILIELAVSVF